MTHDPLRDTLQSTLGSSYTIERELGGGGMSRVFVANDVALGRQVVVKILAPDLAEGVSFERFLREVKLAARLQQANIVPLLTAGDADGVAYYTMPFVDGLSLRARMEQGALPVGEVTNILRDVARALAYAHAQGVVHRDIKPENILLSGGAAVVTDFGIAKAISASRTQELTRVGATNAGLTRAGMSLGTPSYMAPEQALGDPDTDHRADLYAWGVVAWEMLVGAHPFSIRATPQAMIAAHVSEVPPSVDAHRPDVTPALASLVARCLEKDPERRPASAAEVMEALDAVGTPSSTTTGSRRSPMKWAIAAAVIVVVAGVTYARRGDVTPQPVTTPSTGIAAKSLAVLPFASVGGDTANAYFAEGIADELTTALARLPGLRLAGRSSAARYKQRGAGAQEIGAALHVGAVLDGTVRRAGGRIRVSVELASADDGHVIWKESYEREIKDVFAVQDDITKAIVDSLRVQLTGGRTATSASSAQGTKNLEAYDLYLRGLQAYRKRGLAVTQAEQYLTQAIALDPKFARAHATLASVLVVTPYYLDTPMSAVLPRARAAAERAVALDDALPEAHLALGHVLTEAFEWKQAEAELRRAVALDPNRAEILFRLGFMLLTSGRVHESIAAFEQAKNADPLYSMPTVYLGFSLAIAGRKAEGVAEAQRAIDLDPTNEGIGNLYSATLSLAGRDTAAVAFARKMVRTTSNPRRIGFSGWVLGASGARRDVPPILRRIQALPPTTWGRYSSLAYLYLSLGDTAHALAAIDSASRNGGDLLLAQAISSPRFDPIRSSARFAEAMRRYNLDLARVTAPDGGRSR
ncbi:MAG: protein kinase [bacterium]